MSGFDFRFKDIIEEADDIIVVTKALPVSAPGPEIVYVNKAFTRLTGYSYKEAVGSDPRMLQSTDTDPETRANIREALTKQLPIRATIKNYSKSGESYWLDMNILPLRDSHGNVTHFVSIERDVTESKELEFKLDQLARIDSLSGLLNRRAFDEVLGLEMSRFFETNKSFTILALDIDLFKAINDEYGHQAGDRVIQEVSKTCASLFGKIAHVARTGGEEFTILIPDMDAMTALPKAEALREKITTLRAISDVGVIKVTTSIGVSQANPDDKNASKILVRADKALYEAKGGGRNKVCIDKRLRTEHLLSDI